MELAYEFMNLPEKVSATPEKMTAERVEQVLYHVASREKFPLLLGLLRREGMERTMVFVNTKREAEFLRDRLNANEFPCKLISGDVEQKKRLRILEDFREGSLPILIATDVASRGLHIDGISHVINYDLPQDAEDYVHRIGRTARAGAAGKAISFADEDGAFHLEAIQEYSKQKIPVEWADDDLFVHDYKRTKPRPKSSAGAGDAKGRGGRSGSRSAKPKPHARPKAQGGEGPAREPAPADSTAAAPADGVEKKKSRRRPRRKKTSGESEKP
jgi:ATP-dependent RNA helicase RhlB